LLFWHTILFSVVCKESHAINCYHWYYRQYRQYTIFSIILLVIGKVAMSRYCHQKVTVIYWTSNSLYWTNPDFWWLLYLTSFTNHSVAINHVKRPRVNMIWNLRINLIFYNKLSLTIPAILALTRPCAIPANQQRFHNILIWMAWCFYVMFLFDD